MNTQTGDIKENICFDENKTNNLLDNLNELYSYVKSTYNNVSTSNIVLIVNELIQIVEKYKNLTGNQKQMLVINTIKRMVNDKISSDEDKIALNLIIDNTLPHIINSLIKAINGNMKFNKDKVKSFFTKILPCC